MPTVFGFLGPATTVPLNTSQHVAVTYGSETHLNFHCVSWSRHPVFLMMKITKILGLLAVFSSSCATRVEVEPRPAGWVTPKLTAAAQTGQLVDLNYALSGPWAAIFFYPVADTFW